MMIKNLIIYNCQFLTKVTDRFYENQKFIQKVLTKTNNLHEATVGFLQHFLHFN